MGKKQHSKDRMFLTATEWATEWGGKKVEQTVSCKKLPFNCCALSLQPVDDPVCTSDGIVFDIKNIVPYIKKHGHNPVTGATMTTADIFPITFHKNTNGEYICPVSYKVLTEFSHIVAIRPSGNVYSMETIQNLNLKIKDLKDLLTGEEFKKEDIIEIQNPTKIESRLISNFHYVKTQESTDEPSKDDPADSVNANPLAKKVLEQMKKAEEKKPQETKQPKVQTTPTTNMGFQSSLMKKIEQENAILDAHKRLFKKDDSSMIPMAASFTSTGLSYDRYFIITSFYPCIDNHSITQTVSIMLLVVCRTNIVSSLKKNSTTFLLLNSVQTVNRVIEDPNKIKPKKVKDNGYVQIVTNLGPLNFELWCNKVPLASENFITHCENNYYVGVIFHRSIRNFMVQGGDPTGKGTGGQSIWGRPFEDEFNIGGGLTHSGRGILSMANSGPASNGSQFFITYKSAKHLDNKHTVFGKLVGGMETLDLIEKVPTDEQDRPVEEIKIIAINVYQNPFATYVPPEEVERKKEEEKRKKEEESEVYGKWFSNPAPITSMSSPSSSSGVGKYLQVGSSSKASTNATSASPSSSTRETAAAQSPGSAALAKKRPVEDSSSAVPPNKVAQTKAKTDYNRFGNW
eukprot:TRINITY_DN5440_c0_g1_i1.p1 TRINITY_DN5440_c0_g1~~TRINITY_DN5440_c0_g1_i1.p1  ORF type:complete len:628 (-),score=130.09 TRINITY_DN5440_c0_g1_i1:69-1952(-)